MASEAKKANQLVEERVLLRAQELEAAAAAGDSETVSWFPFISSTARRLTKMVLDTVCCGPSRRRKRARTKTLCLPHSPPSPNLLSPTYPPLLLG